MIFLVMLFLVAGVGFYVAYPLWRARPAPAEWATGPEDPLLAQKELTYQALQELEFDYALGNLNPQDHQELEEKYKDRAVAILKQMDAQVKEGRKRHSPEEAIEAEIQKLRRSKTARQAIEDEVMKLRRTQASSPPTSHPPISQEACPECGAALRAGARYCPSCGASLQALTCPQCSKPYKRQDRFCSQCGAALPAKESGK